MKLLKALCVVTTIVVLYSCAQTSKNKVKSSQQWQLDLDRSSIQIVSTKNASIAEVFTFKNFEANIDDKLKMTLQIDMNSLETNIPIRNTRIQSVLFETKMFPTAEVSAQLTPENLTTGKHSIGFEVDAHGLSNSFVGTFNVTNYGNQQNELIVVLEQPLLLNSENFGMNFGLEQLKKIAGLQSISQSVPLTAVLIFKAKSQ